MIESFRDIWLQEFYLGIEVSKKIPADLETRLFRKLQMIDDSSSDLDLRIPPSNHFEKLKGKLNGWNSIRVNKKWRLIFVWDNEHGQAKQIYLDNHDYN